MTERVDTVAARALGQCGCAGDRMAAKALSVDLEGLEVPTAGNFESALSALVGPKIGVLVVSDHAFFIANASVIATVAAGHPPFNWQQAAG